MKKLLFLLTTSLHISLIFSIDNDELRLLRRELTKCSNVNQIVQIAPSVTIKEKLNKKQRYGVCHDYALSRQLDLVGKLPTVFNTVGNTHWYARFHLLNHYEEVTNAQPGDLVVYGDADYHIFHSGIVYGDGLVESKWENRPAIFIHPTFFTPDTYGDEVHYYRKKEKNTEIIEKLQEKILNNQREQELCAKYNQNLFSKDLSVKKIQELLDWSLCVDINTTNKVGQTPLHVAAKRGNKKLAKLFIEYGAHIDKKDKDGNRPLNLAINNKHNETAQLLYANTSRYNVLRNIFIIDLEQQKKLRLNQSTCTRNAT